MKKTTASPRPNERRQRLKIIFLEPFFGGSHRNFAEGLVAHSRHDIDLLTLPAHFWKWRMRGAALHFVKSIPNIDAYDGLITTDLMSLADFKALTGRTCPPALVYFHESQLTYPLAPGESMDVHFGFTDITTALAADRIRFNSHTHFDAFFSALPAFLNMMPDYRPQWVIEALRSKARVLYPGCDFPAKAQTWPPLDGQPPLIIWNHRWEFDKNPEAFFEALDAAARQGIAFRLALLGENFQSVPKAFVDARQRLRERIVCYGYEPSRKQYIDWLKKGALVISTAVQENFGISIVEAVRYGCLPLVPQRLAYPEIIPEALHSKYLYRNQEDFIAKLVLLLTEYRAFLSDREQLSETMGAYAWETLIPDYDQEIERLAKLPR